MDMINGNILDGFFVQNENWPDDRAQQHINEIPNHFNLMQDIAITRELRLRSSLNGAGDGPHNNPLEFAENNNNNPEPFIVLRRRQNSKLWHYMPLLLLTSGSIFKTVLSIFGLDVQAAFLMGISYDAYFSILQWIFLLASYWYKGFRI